MGVVCRFSFVAASVGLATASVESLDAEEAVSVSVESADGDALAAEEGHVNEVEVLSCVFS